ncbi:uncharacterized protein LOC134701028 [Mytilus trossulus]|uniref:uncharacterized protein LOC134701028 n=1 Tax=Mytilus trossulus TaxID=6551 RepID=UPI00300457C5
MGPKRRDTRKRTRGPELDPNNPNNWTSTELKEKLALLGIKISENFTNKQLKRIFLDNKKSSPESSDNGNTEINNISATVNTSLSPNFEDDVILSPTNTQNAEFSSLIPIASTSRMNTVEPTPLPAVGAAAHQNHAFPPRTDLNTLDYALVNNTLQLCQQVIAGVPKQTNNNKFNLHSAMNFNPGPGSTLPVNQNTFGVQNPTLGEFTQTNPNQMNFPNSFASQVPIFSMQNQHMQMTKHGYPATAFSGVDMVSPEIRTKIISDEQISSVSTRGRESSNSLSNPGRDYLDIAVENLQTFAVADSTKALYNVGYEHYLKFLQLQGSTWSTFQLPPVSENLLMRFIAYCESNKHLRYSTIKSYLCGIRFYYLLKGGVNPLENFVGKPLPKLKSVLVGLKKKHAIMPKRIRLPITFDILYKMCFLLRNCIFDSYTDVLIEAACVTAFFGFLRCGEFSVNDTKKFDHESNLCLSDVQITNDCIFVHLKKSKTDPFRYGITIPLFKNNTDLCPVVVLQKYYRLRMSIFSNSESFFITNKGDPLSRNFFISHVKCTLDKLGLSSEKYNGHSFRSGAATTAHKARLEDHLIQTLGRWSSDCYTKYIHTSPDVLRQAQIQMTSTLNN